MFMKIQLRHWREFGGLVLALWLVISPWALAYQAQSGPAWNAVIVGMLIGVSALYSLFRASAWADRANVIMGLWMMASPWVLGFAGLPSPMFNAGFVGLAVFALALWRLGTDNNVGGLSIRAG